MNESSTAPWLRNTMKKAVHEFMWNHVYTRPCVRTHCGTKYHTAHITRLGLWRLGR